MFSPWRRKWQPIPVLLPPVLFHGQRSLVGHSLWGHKGVGHALVTKNKQKQMDYYNLQQFLKTCKGENLITPLFEKISIWYFGRF